MVLGPSKSIGYYDDSRSPGSEAEVLLITFSLNLLTGEIGPSTFFQLSRPLSHGPISLSDTKLNHEDEKYLSTD